MVPGCGRNWDGQGYCLRHYKRWRRWGDPLVKKRRGPKWFNGEGYVVLLKHGHPNARKDGSILEHRLVASEMLGRPLLPEEIIHHRNGNRQDNGSENLEVLTRRSHPTGHDPVECPRCGCRF